MNISVEEFKEIEDDVLVIDVRTKQEFDSLYKVPHAKNIELKDLFNNYRTYLGIDFTRPIVTVCNAGNRSGEAALFLREQGYNARTLSGGSFAYKRKFEK
ncbi:hypothetical protein SCHIN_v1c03690 [Spiroplasma chinense]|uniref:Rhodanese domain-containing protein n=1 Tax=Spiroplasma chinense TaxID=216932 RepID=A0A5B9Y4G0_9MOLU|nr:rhodanese-like domain-containing protein [Spiroplasma chinense]QEH61566.1 hypothetical protein SCHIN_v1c03690 [Spiroplasma chinense]